jgi:uncharacterized protein YdhG (YjbR/CyaY superfamily)
MEMVVKSSASSRRKSKPSRSADDPKEVRAQAQEYFASLPEKSRKRLREVREVIRSSAPDASEGFSYRMPNVRLDGKVLVWYAAFKEHTSLFPMTDAIRRAHAAELKGLKTSRGTIQFSLEDPLPSRLVKRLIKARVEEVRARSK